MRFPSKRNNWQVARLTALLLGLLMLGVGGCAYHPQPVSVFPEPNYLTISAPPQYPSPSSVDPMKSNHNNFEMVHKEPAEFSVQAQEEYAFGFVSVKAVVGIDGKVLSARVTRGVHPLVDQAALEAAKKCTFRRLFPPENSTDYEASIFFQFGK
jgi:TonB family protein